MLMIMRLHQRIREPIKTRTRFVLSSFYTNNEIRIGIIEYVNFGTAE